MKQMIIILGDLWLVYCHLNLNPIKNRNLANNYFCITCFANQYSLWHQFSSGFSEQWGEKKLTKQIKFLLNNGYQWSLYCPLYFNLQDGHESCNGLINNNRVVSLKYYCSKSDADKLILVPLKTSCNFCLSWV